MEDLVTNLPNLVSLTDGQWTMGSLILMVSYGAHFAFIIYFIMTSLQLAPRYRVVAVLSAVVMACGHEPAARMVHVVGDV